MHVAIQASILVCILICIVCNIAGSFEVCRIHSECGVCPQFPEDHFQMFWSNNYDWYVFINDL